MQSLQSYPRPTEPSTLEHGLQTVFNKHQSDSDAHSGLRTAAVDTPLCDSKRLTILAIFLWILFSYLKLWPSLINPFPDMYSKPGFLHHFLFKVPFRPFFIHITLQDWLRNHLLHKVFRNPLCAYYLGAVLSRLSTNFSWLSLSLTSWLWISKVAWDGHASRSSNLGRTHNSYS